MEVAYSSETSDTDDPRNVDKLKEIEDAAHSPRRQSAPTSRQCGILYISQPCWPPRPVAGIALLRLVVFIVSFIACVALCAVFV
jgi:hypothetical protein